MTYKVNNIKFIALRHAYYNKDLMARSEKMSIKDVSIYSNTSFKAIWDLENNPNANPKLKTLCKVCDFYKVDLMDMLIKE